MAKNQRCIEMFQNRQTQLPSKHNSPFPSHNDEESSCLNCFPFLVIIIIVFRKKNFKNIAFYLPISMFVSRDLFLSLRLWQPAATPFRRFCIHQTQRSQRFQTQDLPLLTSTLPSCQQITRLVQRSDGDKFANKYLAASRKIHEMIKVFLVISGHFDFSADHGRAGTY